MSSTPSIWWYGVNSLFAPRTAARHLVADERLPAIAWQLVWMGLAALFIVSFVVNALADYLVPDMMVNSPPMLATGIAGRLIEAVTYTLITLLTLPMGLFFWTKVLKYDKPEYGVLAAIGLSVAVMLLMSPVQELFYVALSASSSGIQNVAFITNFALLLALTAIYYSQTLSISYTRAVLLNAMATFVVLIALVLLFILASFLLWFVGGIIPTPMVGG